MSPRAKNFACQVCDKPSYKKDLFSVSLHLSGWSKNKEYKWTRNIRTKLGVCSGPCSKQWREETLARVEQEERDYLNSKAEGSQ